MTTRIFHICSRSAKIVFRDEEDHITAINRLASCAHTTSTEVWAFTVMSTHFHLIVRTECPLDFMSLYKLNISKWHNTKYKADIHLNLSQRPLGNEVEILTAVNYVLKNPVHHGICETAFSYPYSSVHCCFPDALLRRDCFKGERSPVRTLSPSELDTRTRRKMFSQQAVPETFSIIGRRMVLPESFVAVNRVRYLYRSSRSFLYNMTKPLREEMEMFDGSGEVAGDLQTRVSLFGKKTDIEVCGLIDNIISPKSYTQVTEAERASLWSQLSRQGVGVIQFERAL